MLIKTYVLGVVLYGRKIWMINKINKTEKEMLKALKMWH